MICPKCHHLRTEADDPLIPDYRCPACGVVYSKVMTTPSALSSRISENIRVSKSSPENRKPAAFEANEKPPELFRHPTEEKSSVAIPKTSALKNFVSIVLEIIKALSGVNPRKAEGHILATETDAEDARDQQFDKDAWENMRDYVDVFYDICLTLTFDYKDRKGKYTHRTVDLKKFGYNDTMVVFEGFCHYRRASRTFLSQGIKNCINSITGEIISDIRAYLIDQYHESVDYSLDQLYEEYNDILSVLIHIGRSDEQFRREEKIILAAFCRELVDDERITVEMIDKLSTRIRRHTLRSYKIAIGKLAGIDSTIKQKMLDCATSMVSTQKTVHPNEQLAIDYIYQKLKLN